MTSEALIPLIATIAYIPCLVILLDNRPWQLKQRLFFLLLISAMLWSISDVFFRGSFFNGPEYREVLVRVVLCLAIWMIIQFRYLGQSFYKTEVAKRPFAYIILAAAIALAVAGYLYNMPHSYDVWVEAQGGIVVHYGKWMPLLVIIVLVIGSRDINQLIKRLRASDNAVERNQMTYFFVALGCLAAFGFATMLIPSGGKWPVAHFGNLSTALVLIYTVVAHRLLDVRTVFRRALMYLCLYGGGLGAILLVFLFAHLAFHFEPDFRTLGLTVAVGIPVIILSIRYGRDFLQRKLEQAFVGERAHSRRELRQLIDRTHSTLGELGSKFMPLLAGSLDCRRACLLLPEPETGELDARFTYPPVPDNRMAKLKLKWDSPIVTRLEREDRILLAGSLAILPEFRSMWKEEREEIELAGVNIFVRLMQDGKLVGVLAVSERRDGKPYAVEDMDFLESIASSVAPKIANAQLYARAEQKSRVDELTGLFNRRHFEERMKEEIARHSRYGDAFSMFMVDLDNFKAYNDIYGHPGGDVLLSRIGRIIRSSIRDADQAFRYGGDEFVVVLPQTSRDEAWVVAERVRSHIAEEAEKESINMTCSIGLASYPADGVIAGELVAGADSALYHAKWNGGNQTHTSSKVSSIRPDDGRIGGRRNGLGAAYLLVSIVESIDPYCYGHSKAVNTYAVALAEAMGLSPDEVSRVSRAAWFHDFGKIVIPRDVLNKKEKLTQEDWKAIKAHPMMGANIAGKMPPLVPCVNSILHHHERWDGRGYPDGLKGEEIPVEARILAIADTFEAMSSDRAYRPAFLRREVIEELRRCAGSQFDPNLVDLFIRIVEGGFPEKVKAGRDSTGQTTNP